MRHISISLIIHTFALLHAAVAISCRMAGIEDELFLTILTMAMVLLICLKKNLSIEFSAASIIVANVIGYLMGNFGANTLAPFIHNPIVVHALSTAVTTEVLGWSIIGLTRLFRLENTGHESAESYIKWILGAMAIVFILRMGISVILKNELLGTVDMVNAVIKVFSNSFALITIFCVNIIYIRFSEKLTKRLTRTAKVVTLLTFLLVASTLEAFIVSEFTASPSEFWRAFPSVFATSLMAQLTVYCLVFMANYALTSKVKMQAEIGKANMAQYRYLKLKHQVNPHFLFNSLNILDCLVCEEQSEKASEYIHKLAGIYRYMIKSEDEELVPLRDELAFVQKYIDLLRVRFPEGFQVNLNIDENLLNKFVLPCAIQLLIENAIKHNAVNAEKPLVIKVETDEKHVWVSNNIIPKFGKIESTGLGQKYLRQQYLDLSGKQIRIKQNDDEFKVTLPLI